MTGADTAGLFLTCLAVAAPTFGWLLGGAVLSRLGYFPQALNDRITRLSFNYGLPLMLFTGAAGVDFGDMLGARFLLAAVVATCLVVGAAWIYSLWRGHARSERGIFVQGAYRSNLAIMGLALCIAAYGERGAQLAALAVAVMTSLYNVFAVVVLNATLGGNASVMAAIRGVLRNPLIIGIAAGVLLSMSGLPLPHSWLTASSFLAAFFLPVVLLCVGGAMRLGELRASGPLAWEATAWRLLVAPMLAVVLALLLDVRGEALGALFLLMATPAAASGYIMVAAAGGNAVLAANIVVLTTVLSALTLTLGLFLLSLASLIGPLGG